MLGLLLHLFRCLLYLFPDRGRDLSHFSTRFEYSEKQVVMASAWADWKNNRYLSGIRPGTWETDGDAIPPQWRRQYIFGCPA